MTQKNSTHLHTQLCHLGRNPFEHHGFVNTPAFRGSTILFPTYDDMLNRRGRFIYGTAGTPTSEALCSAWSALSAAAGTITLPTGLNAVSMALLSCVKAGDHVLMTDSVYFPTRRFCDGFLPRLGVKVTYYDPLIGAGIRDLMTPQTTVIYAESPGSQTFEIQDVPALAKAAHERGAALIIDNTWATPLLFSPHEHGADLCVEAGTKYLSGHSDLLLGLVSANEAYWPRLRETYDAFAPCAGPEDQMLALRGLRTLPLRLEKQGAAALEIARWLGTRPEVARVLHPALPSCPGHDIWKRDFKGASGVFSIILKTASHQAAAAMLDHMAIFAMGFSWGGYESLLVPFDSRMARTATSWKPEGVGLRLQIGLEHVPDLIEDLKAGFERLSKHLSRDEHDALSQSASHCAGKRTDPAPAQR